nr:MAG: hypothetical protein 1 [Leviviridae sp.]
MSARSRNRSELGTGTRVQKWSGVTEVKNFESLFEQCDDDTGSDNSIFTVTRRTRYGGGINGTEASNLTGYIWNDYPCGYLADPFLTGHLTVSDRPTDGVLAASLLARSNPSRASTISLEYLSELYEFNYGKIAKNLWFERLNIFKRAIDPHIFKAMGRVAKLNLMIRFGFLPLISDIELLLKFQSRVDDRVKEIERLRTRGLRRTMDLWHGSNTTTVRHATIQSQGVTLHADVTKTTTLKVRGHIRWYASSNWLQSDPAVRAMARKALLGYNIDPTVLYEIMPWSWLIDYFSNLGTVIKASRNLFDAHHDAPRIMEHKRTVSSSSNHDIAVQTGNKIISCSPFGATSETKTRRLSGTSLGAQIGFLNNNQLSILGSLTVLRGASIGR